MTLAISPIVAVADYSAGWAVLAVIGFWVIWLFLWAIARDIEVP